MGSRISAKMLYLLRAVIGVPHKDSILGIISGWTLNGKTSRTDYSSGLIAGARFRIKYQSGCALHLRWTIVNAPHKVLALVGDFNIHEWIKRWTPKAVCIGWPDTTLGGFVEMRSTWKAEITMRSCVCAQEVGRAIGNISHEVSERSSLTNAGRNRLGRD